MDTAPAIVKGRSEPTQVASTPVKSDPGVPAELATKSTSELYATYELDHNKPFLADYYEIGDLWNNPDLSYKDEIKSIDDYLMNEVKNKSLDNTTSAIKDRLSSLEKQAGIDKHSSKELRIKLLAEHAKYLSHLTDIRLGVTFNGKQSPDQPQR